MLTAEDLNFSLPPGWERLEPLLQDALDRSGNHYRTTDVLEDIQANTAQYWPGENCVIVTKLVDYPEKRTIVYWLAAGDLEEIMGLEDTINSWARDQGCAQALLHGRSGWLRVLGDSWNKKYDVLQKDLTDG